MRVLALDYGAARTGVAVSDATGTLARPLGVVERAATEDGLDRARRRSWPSTRRSASSSGCRSRSRRARRRRRVETEVFVGGLRRGSTSRSRRTTSASRRRSRSETAARARGRASRPPICSQSWLDRGRGRMRAAARSRSRSLRLLAGRLRRERTGDAAAGRDDAAARAAADHLPGGVHVREMADRVAAVRKIAIDKRGVTPRLTETGYLAAAARPAAAAVPQGLEAGLDRGLPLPGAVRVHAVHDRQASSSPTS